MSHPDPQPTARFLRTLEIVSREGRHLSFSWHRLYQTDIDADWVRALEAEPQLAERLEAFTSRYGRMQDTIAEKLLPRWLLALAERPGSQLETLTRAERLGAVASVEEWLMARKLRKRLVHEYMEDPAAFAADLALAKGYTLMLLETFNRIRAYAAERMGVGPTVLPEALALPEMPARPGNESRPMAPRTT